MKVLITDNAYNDIQEFVNFSLASDKNLISYVTSLLTYTMDLAKFPELGKFDFKINTKIQTYKVRKLVYKQHKILYYIDTDIHVIGFMHVKKNPSEYIKKLKKEL